MTAARRQAATRAEAAVGSSRTGSTAWERGPDRRGVAVVPRQRGHQRRVQTSQSGGSSGTEQRALVIIPTFNEADNVGQTIGEVKRHLPRATVLVVDDGSQDASRAVALAHGALVLSLPYNLGVGGAMRAGYKYALRHGYDVAVQVDADGQHDPADVPRLMAGLGEADIVLGARFAGVGDYSCGGPRRWAMRLLAWALTVITSRRLTDVTSGFRACNRTAMALFAVHYPVEYLGDTIETLIIASRSGMQIDQVPVRMRPRRHGQPSQSAFRATVYLLRAVIAIGLTLMRERPTVSLPEIVSPKVAAA